ncbi:gfo/Idh/MocA family oxidoreductase [bacterium]|nr:gfo/Idh/MocA family oxidoreductase [bacterium]
MTDVMCRWAILGTAGIARKNWQAIRNAGNAKLTAVASRTLNRAQQFISECQATVPFETAPTACGSYEDLLSRDDVDAIYLPLPTGLRKEWVIKAAHAGKHVLVEKPVGISAADVEEMLAACRQSNVQFMDGVMYMHSARLPALRKTLDDGASVGQIRRIGMQFSFNGGEPFIAGNIRASSELEPHGCLGDLGWYTIRFALWTMQYELPLKVSARMLAQAGRPDSPNPVPTEFSAELFFANNVSASFYCSFQTENQQWASISGTKGHIFVPDFVLPYFGDEVTYRVTNSQFIVSGCQFDMEERGRTVAIPEHSNNHPNAQESQLFRTFSQLALSGHPDWEWGEITLKTQRVMDACFASAKDNGHLVTL